jgi:hypothetical protein
MRVAPAHTHVGPPWPDRLRDRRRRWPGLNRLLVEVGTCTGIVIGEVALNEIGHTKDRMLKHARGIAHPGQVVSFRSGSSRCFGSSVLIARDLRDKARLPGEQVRSCAFRAGPRSTRSSLASTGRHSCAWRYVVCRHAGGYESALSWPANRQTVPARPDPSASRSAACQYRVEAQLCRNLRQPIAYLR